MRLFGKYRLSTFRIIVFGFAALILTGALLLSLPAASRNPGSAGFPDCLFTAASAVCVTGLVVRDTAAAWSPFGQAVILALIQIGGLGVVTAAVSLAFLSGRKIGLMQRSVMQESVSAPQVGGVVRFACFIVLMSLGMEAVGALLLLPSMIPRFGTGKGIWYAVFHAVSAFCNAGFDLMGEREPFSSLTGFVRDARVNAVVMALITAGGVGFVVWDDLKTHGFRWKRYRLQSKAALLTSAWLAVLPALWLFFFEMEEIPARERVLPALFQSVTLRTAGFNTVDLGRISEPGQAMMIACMLVGGSPGSTAGGMKTTTLAVLLAAAFAVFRRKDHASLLGRRIADEAVRQAVAVLMMYLLLFFAGGMAISRLEGLPLMSCLFETASAIGTVGLSLGITARLSAASRLILIALMFLGRVGGLTLIYAAQPVRRAPQSTLPLEKITVG